MKSQYPSELRKKTTKKKEGIIKGRILSFLSTYFNVNVGYKDALTLTEREVLPSELPEFPFNSPYFNVNVVLLPEGWVDWDDEGLPDEQEEDEDD